MRNLFDQYAHPENRLTHAVACCLNEDRELLKRFLSWVGVQAPVSARHLSITEQGLPGDPPKDESEAEARGLPDIVIHDGECWALFIESKVQARLTHDQLSRHESTLGRRGFEQIHRLTLTKTGQTAPRCLSVAWSSLYEWLGKPKQRGLWPDRLRDYLRASEIRLARDKYLTEGTLTMFDGFPFSSENPYTYGEAKRLLKLALVELRKDRSLRTIGMDPTGPGRTAITGKTGRVVWDFIPLRDRPKQGDFTHYPHLTLAIHVDHLEASITIPHRVATPVRTRFVNLGRDRLVAINAEILRQARGLIVRGASIHAFALQRHYLSQRSSGMTDATLSFRLETSQPGDSGRIKAQAEWVELFAQLPRRKRSNMQFQYRVQLPWGIKGLDSRESLKLIAESWRAMDPLLEALRQH